MCTRICERRVISHRRVYISSAAQEANRMQGSSPHMLSHCNAAAPGLLFLFADHHVEGVTVAKKARALFVVLAATSAGAMPRALATKSSV